MKVWVVGYDYPYESTDILAIYDSEKKAKSRLAELKKHGSRLSLATYWMEEYTINEEIKIKKDLEGER